jgi:hypothetical protein
VAARLRHARLRREGPDQGVDQREPVLRGRRARVRERRPRRMSIPLLVGSGAWGSLTQVESLLRLCARPGGVVDIQPDSEAQAVRFDVISGRWEEEYSTPENRALRRKGTLHLDCMPYGYLPTWILLASTASVALPGVDRPVRRERHRRRARPRADGRPADRADELLGRLVGARRRPLVVSRPSQSQWRGGRRRTCRERALGSRRRPRATRFAPGEPGVPTEPPPSVGPTWMELGFVQVRARPRVHGSLARLRPRAVSPSMRLPVHAERGRRCRHLRADGERGPLATLPPNMLAGALTAPSAGFALLDLGVVTTPSVAERRRRSTTSASGVRGRPTTRPASAPSRRSTSPASTCCRSKVRTASCRAASSRTS